MLKYVQRRIASGGLEGSRDFTGGCERLLWQNVLGTAGMDAIYNVKESPKFDAEWHYEWSKGIYCEWICHAASVDWGCIKAGFKTIYQEVQSQGEGYIGTREFEDIRQKFQALMDIKENYKKNHKNLGY